ncbi:hypothetical protein ACEPAH_7620 [Sanghuangporus vaninii]
MPKPDVAQNGQFQFLHLKGIHISFYASRYWSSDERVHCFVGVEVTFKNKRPRYPVKIKLIEGSSRTEPRSKEFVDENEKRGGSTSGASLMWDTDEHLSSISFLEVVVKESKTMKFLSKKDFASVRFEAKEIGKKEEVSKENTDGLISVKLTFAPPSSAGEIVRKGAEDAEKRLEKKPVALQRLGRAREFIDVARNFGMMVADIHPAAKAAVIAFDMLWEKLKKQEEIHEDAANLLEELQLFLPFTEVIDPKSMTSEAAKSAIRDFLDLFKETCELVVQYSSTGVIGDLISTQKPKISQLEKDFRKVKSRYDWSIKTDVWRATLKLEKLQDDEILRLLQVSFTGPAGKEYYRTDRCCLPGTRGALLDQISQWTEFASGQKLYWLHGIAGSGKSAIANTVARDFDEQRLLAGCFFCKRDDPDLRNTDKVIPSLVFHLSVWHQPYSAKLLAILQGEEKNKLASKTVQEQFELLIKGPALELSSDEQIQSPRPLIIIIDALDECGINMRQRFHLAQVLVQVAQLVPWLKLFVTSRPLPEFFQAFEGLGDVLKKLHLNEAGDPTADIMLYTKHRTNIIATENCLDATWLTDEQIDAFTRMAHGLFIWTSTVFNFIEGQVDIDHAVAVVFAASTDREEENPEAALDDIYRMVLQEVGKGGPRSMLLVKTVAGVIFGTARNVPLPVDAISKLIPQFDERVISRVIDQLQAVLYKDIEQQNAIRVCHPSWMDFMSLETRSIQFWTQPSDIDLKLASRCLQVMKDGLSFNICRLETSYLANKDIPDLQRRVATEVSRVLSYSCLYWMMHVQGTDPAKQDELSELIVKILCNEIALYWLEVLSLLGELKKGIQMLSQANVTLVNADAKAMALELFRFVSAFHDAMATSTPHLYLSALAWLPTDCVMAQKIAGKFNGQLPVKQGKGVHWPNTLLTITESNLVRAVAYSRDGLHIASGQQDGTICIRDPQTGNLDGPPLRTHTAQITSVVFSSDGKLIASSSHDSTIQICDVETGAPAHDPIILDAFATSIAFAADGKRLASGSDDGSIYIWDIETGSLLGKLENDRNGASESKVVQVWDTESGQPVGGPLEGHTNWVVSLAYSPDGKYIVSGSYDKTVRIWDAATGDLFYEPLTGHTDYVNSVAVSPEGDVVVSASSDRTIRVWDARSGKLIGKPLKGHTGWIMGVAFSPDGKHIISGAHDESVRVWDLEAGNFGEDSLRGQIRSVAVSPDGKHIASASTDAIIQLWDIETGKIVGKPFEGHTRWVNSIAFSKDGKHLASGSDDTTVRVWDVETHESKGEPLKGHTGFVKSVDFSEDGTKVVSGSMDKTVRLWDAQALKQIGLALTDNNDWVNTVAFSPDGRYVASGADDSTILIWDTETGELAGEPLAGQGAHVFSIAYSPDGDYIAAGFADGSIRIWNIDLDMRIIVFDYNGTSGSIRSVAYSPDGTTLVTGSDERLIEIWDGQQGEAIGEPLAGHTARVVSVEYSSDGRLIVSGSEDGTIRLWEAERTPSAHITEFDGIPPAYVPDDGWIRTSNGELLLWVPVEHRNGVCDRSSMCIPPDALGHLVRVDWDKLRHGPSWADVRKM